MKIIKTKFFLVAESCYNKYEMFVGVVVVVVVVVFACSNHPAICYIVYHFLTKDLKNRLKSKQKIQKQSRN